jgi:hypothetical protein
MTTRVARISLLLVLSTFARGAGPASADWSLGSNLGVSILMPTDGADTPVLVEVPAGSSLGLFLVGAQPGLRLGFTNAARRDELNLDTSLSMIRGGGDTFTTGQMTANFQHAFGSSKSDQPFVTVGVGGNLLSGGGSSSNTGVLGFGVGQRHWFAEGHGSSRFELRYDRIGESKVDGYTIQSGMNVFEMRFGFDLWP